MFHFIAKGESLCPTPDGGEVLLNKTGQMNFPSAPVVGLVGFPHGSLLPGGGLDQCVRGNVFVLSPQCLSSFIPDQQKCC